MMACNTSRCLDAPQHHSQLGIFSREPRSCRPRVKVTKVNPTSCLELGDTIRSIITQWVGSAGQTQAQNPRHGQFRAWISNQVKKIQPGKKNNSLNAPPSIQSNAEPRGTAAEVQIQGPISSSPQGIFKKQIQLMPETKEQEATHNDPSGHIKSLSLYQFLYM
jgi:hypothetical protein